MTETHRDTTRGGLVIGVVAAVTALAGLDLVHLHLLSGQPFSLGSTTPLVWLALALFWLAMGAVLVPLVAAFATATAAIARVIGRRRPFAGRPRLAEAAAVALLCVPPVAAIAWALFQGQGVARTPWLATAGPFVAAPVMLVAVLAAWLVVAWLRGRGPAVRGVAWLFAAAVLGGLFLVDARLFVGLYGYLHLTLSLLALWAAIALAACTGVVYGEHNDEQRGLITENDHAPSKTARHFLR